MVPHESNFVEHIINLYLIYVFYAFAHPNDNVIALTGIVLIVIV